MSESAKRPVRGWLLLAYLVVSAILAGIASDIAGELFWPTFGDEPPDPMEDALFGLLWYALLLPMVLHALRASGVGIGSLLAASSSPVGVAWATLMAVALVAISIGTLYITFLPLSYLLPELVDTLMNEMPPLWIPGDAHTTANVINLLVVVLLGPITEEVVFRGGLFRTWSKRWGVRNAAIVSSLLFGVVHVDVIGGFVFGYVTAMVFHRTRCLWLPIAIHIANNGIAVLLDLSIPAEDYTIDQLRSDWWLGVAGLAVGIPMLTILYRRMNRNASGPAQAPA